MTQWSIEMAKSLRVSTIVSNGRVEVRVPGMADGSPVEVVVRPVTEGIEPSLSVLDIIRSLPRGPRLFQTPEEADRYLSEERDSWGR